MFRTIVIMLTLFISNSGFANDLSSASDEDIATEFSSRFVAKSPTFGQILSISCSRIGDQKLTSLYAVKEGHSSPTIQRNYLAAYKTLADCEKAKSQVPTKVTELTQFKLCVSNGVEPIRSWGHTICTVSPDNSEIQNAGINGEYPFSSIDESLK